MIPAEQRLRKRQLGPRKSATLPCPALVGAKEMRSDSLGIHPSQQVAARAHARKHGCRVDFDPATNQAIFGDHRMRNKYARAVGAVDNDGCWSDP